MVQFAVSLNLILLEGAHTSSFIDKSLRSHVCSNGYEPANTFPIVYTTIFSEYIPWISSKLRYVIRHLINLLRKGVDMCLWRIPRPMAQQDQPLSQTAYRAHCISHKYFPWNWNGEWHIRK